MRCLAHVPPVRRWWRDVADALDGGWSEWSLPMGYLERWVASCGRGYG
jgi:hypothetical protein